MSFESDASSSPPPSSSLDPSAFDAANDAGRQGGKGVGRKVVLREADREDSALMVLCAALAGVQNRALCPKELAELVEEKGWARFKGAQKFALVYTTIRSHLKRAASARPPYAPLLECYSLVGSPSREEERCMGVDAAGRPSIKRGSLWFLSSEGAGFANPFEGVPEKGVKRKRGDDGERERSVASRGSVMGDEAEDAVVVPAMARNRGKGKGKGPVLGQQPRRAATVTSEDDGSVRPPVKVGVKLRLKLRPSATAPMDVDGAAATEDDATGSDDDSSGDESADAEGGSSDGETGSEMRRSKRRRADGRPPRLAAQQRLAMRSYHRQQALEFATTAAAKQDGKNGEHQVVMSPQFMFRPGFVNPAGSNARAAFSDLAARTLGPLAPPAVVQAGLQPAFDYFPRQASASPRRGDEEGEEEGDEEDEDEEEGEEKEDGDYAEEMLKREEDEIGGPPVGPLLMRSGRHRRRSSIYERDPVVVHPEDEADEASDDDGSDADTPATTPRSAAGDDGDARGGGGEKEGSAGGPGEFEVEREGERIGRPKDMDVTLCPRAAAHARSAEGQAQAPGTEGGQSSEGGSASLPSSSTSAPSITVSTAARVEAGPDAASRKSFLKNFLPLAVPGSSASQAGFGFPSSAPSTPLPLPPMLSLADRMGYTSLCETRAPSMVLDGEADSGAEGEEDEAMVIDGDMPLNVGSDPDEDDEVMMVGETSSRSSASHTPDRVGSRASSAGPASSVDSFDVGTVTGGGGRCSPPVPGNGWQHHDDSGDTVMADGFDGETVIGGEEGQVVVDGPETLDLEELDQVWEAESPVVTFVKLEDDPGVGVAGPVDEEQEKAFLTCSAAPYGPSPPPAAAESPAPIANAGLGISGAGAGAGTPSAGDDGMETDAEMLEKDIIVETEVLNTPVADPVEETPVQPGSGGSTVSAPATSSSPSSAPQPTSSSSAAASTDRCKRGRDARGRPCLDFDELAARMSVGNLLKPSEPGRHPAVAAAFGKTLVYATVAEHRGSGRRLAILRGVDNDEIYMPTLLELLDWSKDDGIHHSLETLVAEGSRARLVPESGDIPGVWLALDVARLLVSRRGAEHVRERLHDFMVDAFPGRWPKELATLSRAWRALVAGQQQANVAKGVAAAVGAGVNAKRGVPATAPSPVQVQPARKVPAPAPTPQVEKRATATPVTPAPQEEETAQEGEGEGRKGRRVSARRAALDAKTALAKPAPQDATAQTRSSARRGRR